MPPINPALLLIPILTAVSTLIGLGVIWGALKAQVGHLAKEVERLADHLDRQDHLLTGLQEEVRVRFAQQATKAKSTTRKRRQS